MEPVKKAVGIVEPVKKAVGIVEPTQRNLPRKFTFFCILLYSVNRCLSTNISITASTFGIFFFVSKEKNFFDIYLIILQQ